MGNHICIEKRHQQKIEEHQHKTEDCVETVETPTNSMVSIENQSLAELAVKLSIVKSIKPTTSTHRYTDPFVKNSLRQLLNAIIGAIWKKPPH